MTPNITSLTAMIAMVQEFHVLGNHPVATAPMMPEQVRLLKRAEWIRSEIIEFEEAVVAGNYIKAVDGLVDALYFILGTVVEMGAQPFFADCFEHVHGRNMSKFCTSVKEAEDTVLKYHTEGVSTIYRRNGDYFVVYGTEGELANKILKSIKWKEPELFPVMARRVGMTEDFLG